MLLSKSYSLYPCPRYGVLKWPNGRSSCFPHPISNGSRKSPMILDKRDSLWTFYCCLNGRPISPRLPFVLPCTTHGSQYLVFAGVLKQLRVRTSTIQRLQVDTCSTHDKGGGNGGPGCKNAAEASGSNDHSRDLVSRRRSRIPKSQSSRLVTLGSHSCLCERRT